MKAALVDWDAQWTTPSSKLEQLAPLLAIGVAALVSLL